MSFYAIQENIYPLYTMREKPKGRKLEERLILKKNTAQLSFG